jgi:uncharacterized protein (TIGR01777 family)
VVTRNPTGPGTVDWDGLDLSGFDAVINLAGSPIDQRWNEENKEKIRYSRLDSTRRVVDALRAAGPRPSVLVSQSAEGYYPRSDKPVREDSAPGSGFLSEVVKAWEAEARKAEELGVRVVTARTGVVLSKQGGALKKMLIPFRFGVGGPVAGGEQPFPWVHVSDAADALIFLMDTPSASGPVNVVAPDKQTNKTFTKALGHAIHRPTVFPVPSLAIKMLYGEMGSTVTEGSNPDPGKLEQLGYRYNQPRLDDALRSELG